MTCKPVFYPCNFDEVLYGNEFGSSLSEMCGDVIMSDSGFTKHLLSRIPAQLYHSLMKRAINQGYLRAVCFFISKWPFRVLTLQELVPMFSSLRIVCDQKRRKEMVKNLTTVTTVMINAFLRCCKRDGVLKVLDLRGFPIIDRTVKKLCVAIQTLTTKQPTKQENKFHIFLDCTIMFEDTCCELISATSTQNNTKVTLHLANIDIGSIGISEVINLLDKLKTQVLAGISLKYISFENDSFATLLPIVANFRSITALDISWNNLELPRNVTIFNHLEHIERLDVSSNRLGNRLSHILPATALRKLKFLNLCSCMLEESDLMHLYTNLDGKSSLCELDLSDNSFLNRNIGLVTKLLVSIPDLRVLELENCEFVRENLYVIVECLLKLKKLQFVSLADNQLAWDCLVDSLPRLGSLPSLKCVGLSVPYEFFDFDPDGEQKKKYLIRELLDEINKERVDNNPVEITWREVIIA